MPPTERESLLRAVLVDPADDVPRLVLADHLDEHADDPCPSCNGVGRGCEGCDGSGKADELARERAEFIRVQVAKAEAERAIAGNEWHETGLCSPHCTACPRIDQLREREKLLLSLSGETWCWPAARGFEAAWERGFVSEVRGDLGEFLYLAAELFARRPVTGVRPTGVRPAQARGGAWGWSGEEDDAGDEVPWVLPPELFAYLPPNDPPGLFDGAGLSRRWYGTEERAWEAVSVACVGYGRALNDLPPLDLWAETQPAPG